MPAGCCRCRRAVDVVVVGRQSSCVFSLSAVVAHPNCPAAFFSSGFLTFTLTALCLLMCITPCNGRLTHRATHDVVTRPTWTNAHSPFPDLGVCVGQTAASARDLCPLLHSLSFLLLAELAVKQCAGEVGKRCTHKRADGFCLLLVNV